LRPTPMATLAQLWSWIPSLPAPTHGGGVSVASASGGGGQSGRVGAQVGADKRSDHGATVDLLVIDVEGHEAVLLCAGPPLPAPLPRLVLFEMVHLSNASLACIDRRLKRQGFTFLGDKQHFNLGRETPHINTCTPPIGSMGAPPQTWSLTRLMCTVDGGAPASRGH
jgi:hypothetical protein